MQAFKAGLSSVWVVPTLGPGRSAPVGPTGLTQHRFDGPARAPYQPAAVSHGWTQTRVLCLDLAFVPEGQNW